MTRKDNHYWEQFNNKSHPVVKCLDTINHTFMTVYFSPILRYKNTHYPKG